MLLEAGYLDNCILHICRKYFAIFYPIHAEGQNKKHGKQIKPFSLSCPFIHRLKGDKQHLFIFYGYGMEALLVYKKKTA